METPSVIKSKISPTKPGILRNKVKTIQQKAAQSSKDKMRSHTSRTTSKLTVKNKKGLPAMLNKSGSSLPDLKTKRYQLTNYNHDYQL